MSDQNGVMHRPRRTTRSSLASTSAAGTPQPSTSSNNPYRRPTYSSSRASSSGNGGETPTSSRNTNGTPVSSGRGRGRRGRPPGSRGAASAGSSRGSHPSIYHTKPECIAVRVDGRRSTGGSTSSGGGSRRGAAAASGRRSTYNSRHEYEYHYGSDFDSDHNESEAEEEEEEEESDRQSDGDGDSNEPLSPEQDSKDGDSDSDLSEGSASKASTSTTRLPSPPVPIWLDEEKVPETPLTLPPSSDDLLLPRELIVKAVEIYEPLRRFPLLVRLSPFRFEDFCAALAHEDHSALLAEIHIQLLKCVFREEEANGSVFGPNEVKDTVQALVYFIDHITWPESLRAYLESDSGWKPIYDAITSVEYPFCGPSVRIQVLSWLVDQFLAASMVRETLLGDGKIAHEDHCRACNRLGELLCCTCCPAVYHLECVTPPIRDFANPPDNWKCCVCTKHQTAGLSDCGSDEFIIRHERLGYDRHGRKYWFLVRRLVVESEDGSEVWYYSTRNRIEEVLSKLDADNYEADLSEKLSLMLDDIYRQVEVTEEVTRAQNIQRRKTYLEVESGEKEMADQEPMTRLKSTGLYKLGQEGSFRTYINLFNTDPAASNKVRQNEERDRKRHMSHKFSLTTASECKWGVKDIAGCSRATQISALRSALTHMETVVPTTLMHVNWPMLRKNWLTSIQNGTSALDFSRAMLMISSCIRGAVYNPIWAESAGAVRLVRTTLAEREDKKKAEKREKKDRDEEEDRLKLLPSFIKCSIPIKHQVYKQKGEEYRLHGRWGWVWLSNLRKCKPRNCRDLGLLAGPHKHVIQVKNETGKVKTMLIDPGVYSKLMAKRNLAVKPSATSTTSATASSSEEMHSPVKESQEDNVPATNSPTTHPPPPSSEIATNNGELESESETKDEPKDIAMDSDEVKEPEEPNKVAEVESKDKEESINEVGKKSEEIEPKVEPMEVDSEFLQHSKEEEVHSKNGEVMEDDKKEEGALEKEVEQVTDPKEATPKNEGINAVNHEANDEAMEVDSHLPQVDSLDEVVKQESNDENGIDKEKSVTDDDKSTTVVNGKIEKEGEPDHEDIHQDSSEGKAGEEAVPTAEKKSKEIQAPSDESQNSGVGAPAPVLSATEKHAPPSDDSQGRKFKTELVNVSSGLASAHRILYPKVARRSDYLDSLLHRRLTLMSLEEKQLRATYGDDMVTKAKPCLAAFAEEERRKEREAEEFPGEEVLDDNLTLAGAYTFSCYSSECRKEAKLFMTVKGKNRERLYEKICYSPMCRLKFCLQETTRIKQERLRELDKEKYIRVYKEIEEKRAFTLEGTSSKVLMQKLPEGLIVAASGGGNGGTTVTAAVVGGKKRKVPSVKYPQTSDFVYPSSTKPSIFVLPSFELKKLARTAGRSFTPSGFFQNLKSGSWGWSYPCGRPVFRTSWQYKTSLANTLSAAAMQLRILYASIRWDDILAKIPNTDGKNQVHTDTEIITTEILNHRIVGRFMERVQYLRKMMVVPIDAPKTIREITPSRIGLRKRKRAESPDKTEPVVSEDWVDEEKLELWEIRYYGDRIDRKHDIRRSESTTPSTRTKSGIAIKQPEKFDPSQNNSSSNSSSSSSSSSSSVSSQPIEKKESSSDSMDRTIDSVIQNTAALIREQELKQQRPEKSKTVSAVRTAELMRETIETEMKMQRAVHLSKRDGHAKNNNNNTQNGGATSSKTPTPQPTASQQLQQQKAGLPTNPRNIAQVAVASTPTSSKVGTAVVGKKFFVNKNNPTGNIQGTTTDGQATSAGILNRKPLHTGITINKGAGGTISVVKTPLPTTSNPPPSVTTTQAISTTNVLSTITQTSTTPVGGGLLQPQKLSVVRLADGRLQVRGLLPGQHCYQTSDGKIHVTVASSQVQQAQQLAAANKPAITAAPQPSSVTTTSSITQQATVVVTTTPQQQQQQQQQQQAAPVVVQSPATPTAVTNLASTVASSTVPSSPVVQSVVSVATPPQTPVPQQLSSQPLINISNPAMKTAISTTSTPVPKAPQQIIVQQPSGQHVIIQGTSAQALLQQQQKLQRIIQTSSGTTVSSSMGQVLKQITTTAGGAQVKPGQVFATQTALGSTSTIPGRIIFGHDGKAILISSGTGGGGSPQQTILTEQRKVMVTNKQVIQTVSQAGTIRPSQVIQTNAQGQLIAGQQLQFIQSGQQVHLMTQSTTQVQTATATTSQQQPIVIQQQPKTQAETQGSGNTVKAGVVVSSTASPVSTGIKPVLADGRTVLLSPQQLAELTGGNTRKVFLNKPLQVVSTSPQQQQATAIRPQTPQQILQTSAGGVNLAALQIVRGPGGQQLLIQQPTATPIIQQQQQQGQGQQQVQIVVPSGGLGGQPLVVKKFVKTAAAPVGGTTATTTTVGGSPTVAKGGNQVVQIASSSSPTTVVQNQLTQLLGGNKTIVRLDNNQLATIQLPTSVASTLPTPTSGSGQQQNSPTITRSPGLPISIVSPSKSKANQQQQQKSGTVQVISSSTPNVTARVSSPIPNVTPASIVATPPTTPTKNMLPTVVRVASPGGDNKPGTTTTVIRPTTLLPSSTTPTSPVVQRPISVIASGGGSVTTPPIQNASTPSPVVITPKSPLQQQTLSISQTPKATSTTTTPSSPTVAVKSSPPPSGVSSGAVTSPTKTYPMGPFITPEQPQKFPASPTTNQTTTGTTTASTKVVTSVNPPVATTATNPTTTTATVTTAAAKPAKSTPSKIVAQIFQTPQGPKVVIQGVSPGELTPAQMMQLQAQIQKQLAAQQQQQQQPQKTGIPTKSAEVVTPSSPQANNNKTKSSATTTPPTVADYNTSSQVMEQQGKNVEPPSSQTMTSPQVMRSGSSLFSPPLHSKSPPPAVSPLKVISPPTLPTIASPPPSSNAVVKQVIGQQDLVAAVSSVTEPAVLSPARLTSPPHKASSNAVQPIVAKKSAPRKTPLKSLVDTSPNSGLFGPMGTPINNVNSISPSPQPLRNIAGSSPPTLSNEQQQLLIDRTNALKVDIMEKKKAAATQMKLETQREIQEKLEREKATEMAQAEEEQRRIKLAAQNNAMHNTSKAPAPTPGRGKKRKMIKEMENNSVESSPPNRGRGGPKGRKKRKLFCVCNTAYDSTKFYVGCEKCDNWYHGECIGITEEMSKDLDEYICSSCREQDKKEVYCLCKQPYNDLQFYIQCDKCEDWLHGRCVGVVQGESDTIGDYSCPTCEPTSDINLANSKRLDTSDYSSISRLVKDMVAHRASTPFRKPVTKAQAPNYFTVIKDPMDLQTVSSRVEDRQYERLRDFIGDVTKIFENCRYFNEPTTDIYRNADNLEKFFVQKIWALRQTCSARLRQ